LRLEQTIIIALPVEEVFAYGSALHQAAGWQQDGTSEPAAMSSSSVGVRGTECRRGPNGTTEDWELEITEFEPNRVLGIISRCGAVQVCEQHVLVTDEGNTRYTVSLEMTGSKLAPSVVQARTVNALMNFKWRLEAAKAAPWQETRSPRAKPAHPERVNLSP